MSTDPTQTNLLILSDLHLGEDIKPTTKTGYLRHVLVLERELESFLDHYASTRLDERPWRLIVNGDMVDFLSVVLLPGQQSKDDVSPEGAAAEEDHVYGLGTQPRAARAKMRRVLERHAGVFRALARFIGAGNEVDVIVGNHDVEFHWPLVQETFRKGIASLWQTDEASQRPAARSATDIEGAIAFHPWFYFQEGVVWVEHGHQYDDYCSFDYILNPVAPRKEEIVMNVGAAGLRYVSNRVQGGYVAQQEGWTFWGYLSWSFAQGARGLWRIASGFFRMAVSLIGLWRRFVVQPEAVEERRRAHRQRLSEMAEKFQLAEDTLLAVEHLRRRPVVLNLAKLIMALMLDRLAVGVVTTLLLLVFVLALPWIWAAGAAFVALCVAWQLSRRLAAAREIVDPAAKMKAVPQHIRKHVRAPFVVFGHTHDPVALKLDDGGWYFNTGTWVASEKPGLLKAFTHLLIRHAEGGPRAALCQWRDGESRAFTEEARAT